MLEFGLHELDNTADARQLAGSGHARIAGRDLLDEARARTRHADDKDRHLGRVAVVLGGCVKLRHAGLDQAVDVSPERRSVVPRSTHRQELTMKRIRLGKAGEGFIVPSALSSSLPNANPASIRVIVG